MLQCTRFIRRIAIVTLAVCLVSGCEQKSAEDLQMEAMMKASKGDIAGAMILIDQAIKQSPNDPSLLIVRGGLHDVSGDAASAIADYESALTVAPHLRPGLASQLDALRQRAGVTPGARLASLDGAQGPSLTHVTFCSERPTGYREYVEQPAATYVPGETVWIYLDVDHLASRPRGDGRFENDFREQLTLRTPSGEVLLRETVLDEVRVIPDGLERDRIYLHNHINIPAHAPAGTYAVQIKVRDEVTGASGTTTAQFHVAR